MICQTKWDGRKIGDRAQDFAYKYISPDKIVKSTKAATSDVTDTISEKFGEVKLNNIWKSDSDSDKDNSSDKDHAKHSTETKEKHSRENSHDKLKHAKPKDKITSKDQESLKEFMKTIKDE